MVFASGILRESESPRQSGVCGVCSYGHWLCGGGWSSASQGPGKRGVRGVVGRLHNTTHKIGGVQESQGYGVSLESQGDEGVVTAVHSM